jgi:hypothetical protein
MTPFVVEAVARLILSLIKSQMNERLFFMMDI